MSTQQRFQGGQLVEQWTNATQPGDATPAGYTAWDGAGNVTTTRPLAAPEAVALAAQDSSSTTSANQATLQQRALSALTANTSYLAISSPTNAQNAAQVKTLTQECSALIRLMLNLLDSTA